MWLLINFSASDLICFDEHITWKYLFLLGALWKCINSSFTGYYSFAKNAFDSVTAQPNEQSLSNNVKSIVVDISEHYSYMLGQESTFHLISTRNHFVHSLSIP